MKERGKATGEKLLYIIRIAKKIVCDIIGIMIDKGLRGNMNQKEKKRTNHAVRNTALGTAIVFMLLAGGMYGLGGGKDLFPGKGTSAIQENTADASSVQENAPMDESEPAGSGEQILQIIVSEDRILYNGTPVSIEELEEHLLKDYDDASELEVRDDHAIKAEYDEVQMLLERLGIQATEG